ncbi:MAG: ABC transporter ATP-binding protein/permease [candidate division KSB1 bacterium]|nr:ABC transporter ATP-binding protein/permease [candidate division KSB1 bacterium]MDZ7342637.1 ABC transporter ATP-binding protein/permease [candidate division KSB1 bacterium]
MNQSYHEEEVLGKAYDSRLLRRLLTYLKPYWLMVIAGALIIIISTGLDLAGPFIVKEAIDQHIVKNTLHGLRGLIFIYLAILLGQFGVKLGQTYIMQWLGQHVVFDIRLAIFRHLQRLSLAFFDKNPVGRLVTRVTTDVEALNEWFSAGIVSIFGDIFLLIGIIAVMVTVNWRLALITFSVIPLLAYITFFFRQRIRSAYRDIRTRIARINAYLQENISGMTVVQIFNRESRNFKKFDELNKSHLEAHLRSVFYYSLFWPSIDVIEAIALALIIWFGGMWKYSGAVTFGILVLFIQYSRRFFQPISDLTEKYNILQAAMASSERIFMLLDTQPEIVSPAQPERIANLHGEIEFRHVWFAYKNKLDGTPDYVLKDISFRVQPGEKVAIVGATGAGKSSVIHLICRFYDVSGGEILIDGVNIKKLHLATLRRHIGLVQQDVFLFAGTVEENIRLGRKDISSERVIHAAMDVNAHHFIEQLPQRYQEQMMERGASLSTGQKQLLAFARVLAYDPRILILDEATSSVDTESELLIQQALKKLMVNRTSICIAHRLSTIQNCDRIIVMHKGTIREEGTHQQLLKLKGIYYRLYRLQFMDRKVSEAV